MRDDFVFSLNKHSGIWDRIRSDDATRLRLKYDAYYHIFEEQNGTRVKKTAKNMSCSQAMTTWVFTPSKIKEAGVQALQKWGSGTTETRLANGGRIFIESWRKIWPILPKEACHIFSAGYLACASAITGFIDRKDIIFADKNLHSSLWSGIQLTERIVNDLPTIIPNIYAIYFRLKILPLIRLSSLRAFIRWKVILHGYQNWWKWLKI